MFQSLIRQVCGLYLLANCIAMATKTAWTSYSGQWLLGNLEQLVQTLFASPVDTARMAYETRHMAIDLPRQRFGKAEQT